MRFILLNILVLGLGACSSLKSIDKDNLNHPAMEFSQNVTPLVSTPLTQLSTFKTASSSGTCGACAH